MPDKVTKDIRSELRKVLTVGGRYATGTAKLFLASGKEMFKTNMPAVAGMYDTNRELLTDAVKFLKNPADAINVQVNRAIQSESYNELKKFAKYALDDLKTGNLYDPNRDRSDFGMQIDEMLSSFGGVDMDFDEDGNWIESDASTEEIETEVQIAQAQEENAGRRTAATIDAIGASTEAIVQTNNANSQQALRMNMKQHSQAMNMMQNIYSAQTSTFELISKSVNAQLDITKEVHEQMMNELGEMKSLLTEIRDNTAPKKMEHSTRTPEEEIFGSNGELNIKNYLKRVVKNVDEYFGISTMTSAATGGMSVKDMLQLVSDNPWQLVSNLILGRIVDPKIIKQMQNTNKNVASFFPALLQKFGERGKRFERGEGTFMDMMLGFFGINPRSRTSIDTDYKDPLAQANFTAKTTRAIEEVIPMWLSRIYSAISGGPLEVYNYKTGKLERASNIIANTYREANDLVGRMGESSYEIINRAKRYNFKTTKEADDFNKFIYRYLQKQAEDNRFVNPYISQEEFMKTMPLEYQSGNQAELYYKLLMGILQAMPRDKLMSVTSDIHRARSSRDRNNDYLNQSIKESGQIAAFSGFFDNELKNLIESKSVQTQYGLSESEIDNLSKSYQNDLRKRNLTGMIATNTLLNDILGTLKKGIITYSYQIGKDYSGDVSPILDSVLEGATNQHSIEARILQKIADDKRDEERRREEERQRALEAQRNPNRPETDYYVSTNDIESVDSAKRFQSLIEIATTPAGGSNNPEVEQLRRIQQMHRDSIQGHVDSLKGTWNDVARKTGISRTFAFLRAVTEEPFRLFDSGMKLMDAFMFKALFGEDAANGLEINGEPYLLQILTRSLQTHFKQAKDWFSENIGSPLKKYLFDKEEGLLPRIGKALGLDKLKERAKEKAKQVGSNIKSRFIGTKDAESGQYSGGLFSSQINKTFGVLKNNKGAIVDQVTGAVNHLLYGNYATEHGRHTEEWESTYDGFVQTTHAYGGVIGSLRKGFDNFKEMMFGPEDEETDSKKKWKTVTSELNKAFPHMIIGGGAGLLASLFLPGGPVLGAVLGSTMGLVKGSDQLKSFLFGEFGDEDETYTQEFIDPITGKKSTVTKTRKKQTKKGLIDREIADGFKKFAPKITGGALAGAIAGGLGILPFGMGHMAGMILGGMGGMLGASEQVQRLIFGDGVDPKTGLISKEFREKVTKQVKRYAPAGIGGAAIGGLLGQGFGLIPGMSLLPGGPIFALMGSMMGVANADKINEFFFGKDTEVSETVTDEHGNTKTVKRNQKQGGLFNRIYDFTRDKVLTPFATKLNETGHKINGWFQESVIGPLARSVKPLQDRMSEAGRSILDAFKNMGEHITNSLFRVFNITFNGKDGEGGLKEWFQEKVMKRLENTANKIFDVIGKALGTVISAPFKLLEYMVTGGRDSIDREDARQQRGSGFFSRMHENLQNVHRKSSERRQNRAQRRSRGFFTSLMGRLTNFTDEDEAQLRRRLSMSGVSPDQIEQEVAYYRNRYNRYHPADTEPIQEQSVFPNLSVESQQPRISDAQRIRNNELKERLRTRRSGTTTTSTQSVLAYADSKNLSEDYFKWKRDTGGNGSVDDFVAWRKQEKRRLRDLGKRSVGTGTVAEGQKERASDAEQNQERTTRRVGKKSNNDYLSAIASTTKKIYNEIKGQVNGVGWNTAYIKTILAKQYGELDDTELPEEMEGSKRTIRKRRGILGRIKDKASDIFGGLKDRVSGGVDKVKGVLGTIFHPFQLIAEGAKYAYGALKSFAGGIKEVLATFGSMVKELLIGAAKGVGEAIQGVGKFLKGIAGGIGKAVGDALSTVTGALHDAALGISSLALGFVQTAAQIAPDIAQGLWSAAKGIGKGIWRGAKAVGRGVTGAIGNVGSKIFRKITGRGEDGERIKVKKKYLGKVIVDGGFLDKIEKAVPIAIGGEDGIRQINFPYVQVLKGKISRRVTNAIPVFVMGFDRWAKLADQNPNKPVNDAKQTDAFVDHYQEIDRAAERSSNPAQTYDRAIAQAQSRTEIEAIMAAQQMNASNHAMVPAGSGTSGEAKDEGWLNKLIGGSTIFNTIKTVGSGLLTVLLPALASILGIKYGMDTEGEEHVAGRGAETLLQTGLRGLGLNKLSPNQIKSIIDNPSVANTFARQMTGEAAEQGTRSAIKQAAKGSRGIRTFGSIVDFGRKVINPAEADAAISAGKLMGKTGMVAKGTIAKTIGNAGRAVGNAASALKTKAKTLLTEALNKFLKNGTVQKMLGSNFAKKTGAFVSTIVQKLTGDVFEKATKMVGSETVQGVLKSIAGIATGGIVTAAFAIVDFITGWNSADTIFNVHSSQVTTGMKVTAALYRALSGIISIIPGVGTILSIAFSLLEDSLVQIIYPIFADADAEHQLAENQAKVQAAATEAGMTVDEYVKNYNEDGTEKKKGFFSKAWDAVKSGASSLWSGFKSFIGIGDDSESGTGKGPMKHFSQSSAQWNRSDPTMKQVGCGPTVAAMVASAYGKGKSNPAEANMMSKSLGMRASDGGTDPRFFSQYAAGKGFGMEQGPATSGMVSSNLAKGRPVVLMGKGGAFGDNVHYLVADRLAGKGRANVVDPITGGSSSVPIGQLMKHTTNTIYSYGKGPTKANKKADLTNADNVETTDGSVSVDQAQQALVNRMKSIAGDITYDQGATQDPDKGVASCASTVAWAYNKVLGFKPGGAGFASSSAQSRDSKFKTVYQNNGSNLVDTSTLEPGDIVYINWNRTKYDGSLTYPMGHTEMYVGDGMDYSHGGPNKGPVAKTLNDYRKKHIMQVRRYIPFTNGDQIKIYDDGSGAANVDSSGASSSGDVNEPSGIRALNSITDAINSIGSSFDKILNPLLGQATEDTEEESESGDTSVDGASTKGIPISKIRGSSVAQQVWNFLKDNKFNDYGAAGIMGNMYKESGLQPNNLQNTYNSKFGLSDEEYTKQVDNGTYKNFSTDKGGYGLVQWTPSSRKSRLYNLAKERNKSVSDVGTQLDLMLKEITEYGLLGGLQYAKSVQDASDIFLTKFEKPANAESQKAARAAAAQSYYEAFAGKDTTDTTTTTGKGPGLDDYFSSWGTGSSTNLNALNNKVKSMNQMMIQTKDDAKQGSTVTQITKQILNDVSAATKSESKSSEQAIELIAKSLAQMIELLAAIKDNTANTEAKSKVTSGQSNSPKTARADNFSANPSTSQESGEDVGAMIADRLTAK